MIRDLVASFQRAVVSGAPARPRAGGASVTRPESLLADRRRRRQLAPARGGRAARRESLGLPLFVPPIALSTDNAAMIGAAGFVAYRKGRRAGWDLNAEPHLPLG